MSLHQAEDHGDTDLVHQLLTAGARLNHGSDGAMKVHITDKNSCTSKVLAKPVAPEARFIQEKPIASTSKPTNGNIHREILACR